MQLPFSGTRAVFLSLICAGVLSILGVFGMFPRESSAALVVPTTVAQEGTVFGSQQGLGWFPSGAWRGENQSTQRIVHVRPNNVDVLLAAVVRYDSGQPFSSTNGVIAFRMSYDAGLTWGQAIRGSTLTLDLVDDANYFSYSLYVDPNGYDVWVGYVTAKTTANNYPKTTIRKLSWDSAGGWQFGANGHAPQVSSGPTTVDASPTALGVEVVGGKERVWTILALRGTGLPWALPYGHYYWLAYTENDVGVFSSSVSVSWSVVGQVFGTPSGYIGDPSNTWQVTGPLAKFSFVPVGQGATKSIAVVMAKHKTTGLVNLPLPHCESTTTAQEGIQVYILKDSANPAAWSNGISLASVYPYQETGNYDCNGNALGNDAFPFDFSVGYLPSNSAVSTRVLLTYEGGTTLATPTVYENGKLRVKSCTITAGSVPTANCDGEVGVDIANQYFSPQVGFHQDKGFIAARASNNRLVIFKEDPVNTWTQILVSNPNPTVYAQSPATPAYGPYNATTPFSINSGLPPVAWAEDPTQYKVNFSANNGGNLFGWGWSSNFGWLSLNCANEGLGPPFQLATDVCKNPYGVNVKEPPTAPKTLSGSAPYNTPLERATGIPSLTFNPNGYPLSGFGWSSNAGWFTMDRSYSVQNPTNPNGGPPAQDYNILDVSTHPIAKYVPGTQKIHGWGRFLNLCNFDTLSQQCQSPNGGWVRMRGYWIDSARQSEVSNVVGYVAGAATITVADCTDFSTNPGLGMIGAELFTFSGCAANTLTITSADRPQNSYAQTTKVSNVTDQGYGVDGYWSGSRYEVSGWAWSAEYGWIHFRPTLFAGFAWLETLFGNIYTSGQVDSLGNLQGGSIQLPNPQDAAGTQLDSCDTNGDGTANEPCYTATYRIEAGGDITTLTVPGTGQNGGFASSAIIDYIQTLIDPVTGQPYKILNTPSAGALDPYVSRSLPIGQAIPFPTVSPDSTTFRNALGKIDIGALTTFVGTPEDENHSPSHVKYGKDNRLGNELIKTDQGVLGVVTWNLSDLVGYAPASGSAQLWASLPLNTIRNQVIHVQGDLEMLPSDDAQTTITSNYAAGAVTMQVANTVNFPKSGYLIVNAGTSTEEYFRYTAVPDGTHFSLTSLRTPALAHASGQSVRWAWKLPDSVAADGKADTATIVVDGDLNIQYNIFSQTPSGITDIKQVPTLAFIVRGNVNIAKEVNRVDSAFIVLSRDSTKDPGTNCVAPDSCSPYTHWGGVFDTGDDVSLCDPVTKKCNPLKIKGMLFARQFNFLRVGDQNLESPGEQVTFDSNLLLNPPPGLGDLTKALPRITRINQ